MKRKTLYQAVATMALLSTSNALWAQNTLGYMPSSDTATAPLFPYAVPNNAQPLANIRAITGFGRTFDFGSSSSDTTAANPGVTTSPFAGFGYTHITEVWTNGHANYVEKMSAVIGATNVRGSIASGATNFAVAGTNSATALPQVTQFQNSFGRFNANDVVVFTSGINDFSAANSATNSATALATAANDATNQTTMLRQLIGLGARNLFVTNLPDFGTFNYFNRPGSNNDQAALTQGAAATNAALMPNLVALQRQTGANIHYFDMDLLVRQVRANPTAYGFTAAGVAPGASCGNLGTMSLAGCTALSFAQQNQYLSLDGIHYTDRYHNLWAAAMANQMLAPNGVAAQADLIQSASDAFTDAIGRRMDMRRGVGALAASGGGMAAGDAAIGGHTVYVQALYSQGKQADRLGATGMDYSVGGILAGVESRLAPSVLGGVALSYATPRADLNNGFGSITADSYQIGGYLSWSQPGKFVDLTATMGKHDMKLSRSGLISNLTASPESESYSVDTKMGYLFAIAGENEEATRLGPILGARYRHTRIKAYSEQGDELLNQTVSSQTLESVIGRAGIGLRSPIRLGSVTLNSWADLTMDREFRDGSRNLTTALSGAPDLPITTTVDPAAKTFYRLSGGLSANIRDNLSINVGGSYSQAKDNHDTSQYAFSAGVKLLW
ncbi:MAG: autotransporter domain-containing protein [Betaproteobacteria bacterium]